MIGTDQMLATITSLKPGTEYILRVLAYTVHGNGAATDLKTGTTFEACKYGLVDRVVRPAAVQIIDVVSTSI